MYTVHFSDCVSVELNDIPWDDHKIIFFQFARQLGDQFARHEIFYQGLHFFFRSENIGVVTDAISVGASFASRIFPRNSSTAVENGKNVNIRVRFIKLSNF